MQPIYHSIQKQAGRTYYAACHAFPCIPHNVNRNHHCDQRTQDDQKVLFILIGFSDLQSLIPPVISHIAKCIANSKYRNDIFRILRILLQLPAESPDIYIECIFIHIIFINIPYFLKQHLPYHNLTPIVN